MIHFISFGQTGYYEDIAIDLLKNLKKAFPLSKTMVYNQTHLPDDYIKYAHTHKRGYGYMRWKPYVINKYLQNVNEDDIVIYLDGRCHFDSQKINWLDIFVAEKEYDFCVWQMEYSEFRYITSQVFQFFGLNLESYIAYSGQIASGLLALRKNSKTLSFIDKWVTILRDEADLFNDKYNLDYQKEGFIENRHDQSAFSLLIKLFKGNVMFIFSKDVNIKNSVYTHFKSHNLRYANLKNNGKIYLIKLLGYKKLFKLLKMFHKSKKHILNLLETASFK